MQIDPSAPADKPEVAEMIVIHKAFRREFALLPAVIRQVPAGDVGRAEVVARHARLLFDLLHEHHESEDRFLWPLLHERVTLEDELIVTMEKQHGVIAEVVESLGRDLQVWRTTADVVVRDRLVTDLDRLQAGLTEHLELEETEVLPLIHEHLTVPEWKAPQKAAAEGAISGFRAGMLVTGLILEDGTSREREWFLGELPGPVRPMWRLIGHRMYAKHVRTIRQSA